MLQTVDGVGMALYIGLGSDVMQLFAIPFTFCASRCLQSTQRPSGFTSRKKRLWVYDLLFILIIIAAFVC